MARSVLCRAGSWRSACACLGLKRMSRYITRKHPVFLLMSLLLPLMGFAALVAVGAWLGTLRPDITVPLFIVGFILCLLWLAWNLHNWANDYYIITNHRMVGWKKFQVSESRQETPLGMVVSVGVQSTQTGRVLGYADVVVRTIIGNVRFNRVANADIIEHLVDVFWHHRQTEEAVFEEEKMHAALRQKLGGADGTLPVEAKQPVNLPREEDLPAREKSFFAWMFGDFLKARYEIGGVTTYRNWFVLLKSLPARAGAGWRHRFADAVYWRVPSCLIKPRVFGADQHGRFLACVYLRGLAQ